MAERKMKKHIHFPFYNLPFSIFSPLFLFVCFVYFVVNRLQSPWFLALRVLSISQKILSRGP